MPNELFPTKLAVEIGWETTIGIPADEFPLASGNCFSVRTDDGHAYNIVNFGVENLREAVRRGVSFPVKILAIDDQTAVIHDERIPDGWYFDRWCIVCCPEHLLPLPQRLAFDRHEKQGFRQRLGSCIAYHPDRRPSL